VLPRPKIVDDCFLFGPAIPVPHDPFLRHDGLPDSRRAATSRFVRHKTRGLLIRQLPRAFGSIAVVVGHKRKGITLGTHSGGPLWEQMRACVEAVRLPEVPTSQKA
jgi:hypothetical protein